jgi:hypothetical protein
VHKSDRESWNLDRVRIAAPMHKVTTFFVLRCVYTHHGQPFLNPATSRQSVIVQDFLCPCHCGVMLLLDLAQR